MTARTNSGIVVAFQHDISGLPHVVVGAFGDESSVGHYRKFVVRAELYEKSHIVRAVMARLEGRNLKIAYPVKVFLKHGPYTEILKSRISSASGHLDNADAAGYLARIYTPQLTHVFLCHLSNDNNTPELALEASRRALADTGIAVGDGSGSPESQRAQIQLTALPRYDASPLYVFREP